MQKIFRLHTEDLWCDIHDFQALKPHTERNLKTIESFYFISQEDGNFRYKIWIGTNLFSYAVFYDNITLFRRFVEFNYLNESNQLNIWLNTFI